MLAVERDPEAALALCEEVRALTDAQQKEYGEQHEATATVQKAWAEAQLPYSDALKTARIAFRGNQSAHTSLMLGGIRKKTLNGWFDQASRFYNNLLGSAEFKAAMLPYGYTQAQLEAESALVAAVKTAIDAQYKELSRQVGSGPPVENYKAWIRQHASYY